MSKYQHISLFQSNKLCEEDSSIVPEVKKIGIFVSFIL